MTRCAWSLGHPLGEAQQRRREAPLQEHLALSLALRRQHLARHVRVPDPLEELARGVLGVVEFVELGGGRSWDHLEHLHAVVYPVDADAPDLRHIHTIGVTRTDSSGG